MTPRTTQREGERDDFEVIYSALNGGEELDYSEGFTSLRSLQRTVEQQQARIGELERAIDALYPPLTTTYTNGGRGPAVKVTLPIETYNRLKLVRLHPSTKEER